MANPAAKTAKQAPSRVFKDLGLMRARVEYNNDPYHIGRVKVRIPSIHGIAGTSEIVPAEDLPWATPCVVGGCGEDFGQFIAPVPGTFVWVMFEDNDTNKPVYFGGCPSKGGTLSKKMNNLSEEESPLQVWYTEPLTPEVATDVFDGKSTGVPERHVIYKSQKGHTIIFDDTDGDESISIIDRLGQVVKFRCPVSVSDNEGGYRRKLANALDGKQMDKGINPSIIIRTGETDSVHKHNQLEIFMDHYSSECVDSDTGYKTITETTPISFLQQTYKSIFEMLHESIRLEYEPAKTKLFICDDYTQLEALEKFDAKVTKDEFYIHFGDKCELKMSDDGVDLTYDGNGVHITKDDATVEYKDSKVSLSEDSAEVSGKESSVKGSDAGMHTKEGKTYVEGDEVHLN